MHKENAEQEKMGIPADDDVRNDMVDGDAKTAD
jgi:hypothetical protein